MRNRLSSYSLEEGLPALFFFIAGVILVLGSFGTLTIPGIIASLSGIFFIRKPGIAALIGITAASGSLAGQSLTAFCLYCALSATSFAIAGLIALALATRQHPAWILVIIPLFLSLGTFVLTSPIGDARTEAIIVQKTRITVKEEVQLPELYFMPSCKSCPKVLEYLVAEDPKGQFWQPVVVPNSSLLDGEKKLRSMGYVGKVICASGSPGRMVPCLLVNGTLIEGATNILKESPKILNKER